MNVFSRPIRLVCAAAVGAIVVGATVAAAQPVSEARVIELMMQARQQVMAQQASPAPVTVPAQPERVVNLTLNEAVRMALDQNIEISVQRLNPQIQDYALAQARAPYRPTLTSAFGDRSSRSAGTSQISGGTVVDTGTYTYNAGISQALRWTGATVSFSFNNNRTFTTSNNALVNPNFSSSMQAQITQPLLRNRAIDGNRQSLLTAQISRDLADVALKATTINTVASVRNAYWDFVYATQVLEAARASLDLARKLVEDNQTRVEIGTMAPIDVVSAQAEVANRQQSLVAAEASRRTTELSLKRLLVSSTQDPLWEATINPVDRPPAVTPESIDLKRAIETALSNRTDIVTARENLRSSELNLKYLRNQTLPGLDLTATYTAQGSGGTRYVRDNRILGSPITETIPGGYLDALAQIRKLQLPSWNVQVSLSYPLGTSSQDASYARAKVQYQQSQAQLRALELQVATDLTSAALQIQNYYQQIQAAQASLELAEKKLEAEQSKFEVGMSTNYTVVQFQRDLRDAQNSHLRALLNYRKALVDFERLQLAK